MAAIHCPRCSQPTFEPIGLKKWLCFQCEFVFYRNAPASVAVIIRCKDEILLAVRGRDPGKGLLDLPGGFVDPGESLEEAVHREIKEELALKLPSLRYMCSGANEYLFADVVYHTTDAFFEVRFDEQPAVTALDDVASVGWYSLSAIDLSKIAFESQRIVLRDYCAELAADGIAW